MEKLKFVEKEGMVIQSKYIEDYNTDDGKTFHVFGIAIKTGEGDILNKAGDIGDMGMYYSTDKEDTYFIEGHKVSYMYARNEKETKRSRIKPVVAKSATVQKESPDKMKNYAQSDSVDKYVMFKKADAISFSASYAKDLIVAGDKREFTKIADELLGWQLERLQMIK